MGAGRFPETSAGAGEGEGMNGHDAAPPRWRLILRLMRPTHWTKNGLVVAAYLFALGDRLQPHAEGAAWRVAGAVGLFCLMSSAVYLLNDIRDREQDRRHPLKRARPVAAGLVSVPLAAAVCALLAVAALGGALLYSRPLAGVLAAYLLLQGFYSFGLKRVALLDVFAIAAGFVLRALAGAVVIGVAISPWLLLCTLLLALFLALCKRRHEKATLDPPANARPARLSMRDYDIRLLDQLIAMAGTATVVCYSIYTLWPDTVEKFGTTHLGFTVPFVLFGLFRYLDLVYRHDQGDRPEHILLTDVPLLVNIALYGLTVLAILT
jgi:4-hydroxybenzoate polyprenyltransferase